MNKNIQITGLCMMAFLCQPVSASVLTFDIVGIGNGQSISQNYGDRIASTTNGLFSYGAAGGFTQNIEVSYATEFGGNLQYWSTGYNNLNDVLENEADGQNGYSITFTADAGFNVALTSFNLGNFGGAVTLPGLTITDGLGTTLFSQLGFILPASSAPTALSFVLGSNVVASEITIHVDTTALGGSSDNVGLDNIQFSQVSAVPIPAAAWLFGSGLLSLAGLARRKKV